MPIPVGLRRKKQGLTFIEVCISLLLINLIFFAFIGLVSLVLKSDKQGEEVSEGMIVANSILEEYIADNKLKLVPEKTGTVPKNPSEAKDGETVYKYQIITNRLDGNYFTGSGLFEIIVKVSYERYTEKDKKNLAVSISTIICGTGK